MARTGRVAGEIRNCQRQRENHHDQWLLTEVQKSCGTGKDRSKQEEQQVASVAAVVVLVDVVVDAAVVVVGIAITSRSRSSCVAAVAAVLAVVPYQSRVFENGTRPQVLDIAREQP